MIKNEPKVLVVILNYKTPQLTLDLVDSLKKINYHQFSIMVIDNASPDDSARILSEYADDKWVCQEFCVNRFNKQHRIAA